MTRSAVRTAIDHSPASKGGPVAPLTRQSAIMSLMAVTKVPPARPMAPPPPQRVNRPPKPHAPGKVPDPRRPRVVPDIAGNELGDLFLFFADLPWAPRPPRRLFTRLLVFAVILTGS